MNIQNQEQILIQKVNKIDNQIKTKNRPNRKRLQPRKHHTKRIQKTIKKNQITKKENGDNLQ